jgi:hypothetical protein
MRNTALPTVPIVRASLEHQRKIEGIFEPRFSLTEKYERLRAVNHLYLVISDGDLAAMNRRKLYGTILIMVFRERLWSKLR